MADETNEQFQNIPRDVDPQDPETPRKLIDIVNQLTAMVTTNRRRIAELEQRVFE